MNHTATSLEPFPRGTDYFTALGLPRRLNIDARSMEAAFYDRSRRFHPDRYATAGSKARIVSLENTALVNKAYKTLRDPWERARYLVELESGAKAELTSQPPMNLFEDILELQEQVADLRTADAEDAERLKPAVARAAEPFRAAYNGTDARLQDLFDRWDALPEGADEVARTSILTALLGLLGERRYLHRVTTEVDAALGTAA